MSSLRSSRRGTAQALSCAGNAWWHRTCARWHQLFERRAYAFGRVLALLAIVCLTPPSWARDYFISSSAGSDGNEGTETSPWKTLARLQSITLGAGDRVLLKRGDIWREILPVNGSGSAGAPLIISSYGAGDRPVINGSMVVSAWEPLSNGIYRSPQSWEFEGLLQDQKPLRLASSVDMDDGNWRWSSQYLYYKPTAGTPLDHLIERTSRAGLMLINRDYIRIEGISVYGANGGGIQIYNSRNVYIIDCFINCNAGNGISVVNDSSKAGRPCRDIYIIENQVSWNVNGIYLISQKTGEALFYRLYVLGNKITYSNYDKVWGHLTTDGHAIGIQNTSESFFASNVISYNFSGIALWVRANGRGNDNVFSRNIVHQTQTFAAGQGGEGTNTSTGNVWACNFFADNGLYPGLWGGLRISKSQLPSNQFFNNVFIRNDINIYLYSGTDFALVKNNISYYPKLYHLRVEMGGGIENNVVDENQYFPDKPDGFWIGKGGTLTFAAWKELTSMDAHSYFGHQAAADEFVRRADELNAKKQATPGAIRAIVGLSSVGSQVIQGGCSTPSACDASASCWGLTIPTWTKKYPSPPAPRRSPQ